jgi:putative hydrolase
VTFPGPGEGNFLEQVLGDLLRMMGQAAGGSRLDLARTVAQAAATGNAAEPNVDPVERIALEELVRVAELHVGQLTGLSTAPSGRAVEVHAVNPGAWSWTTVEDWRFLLDAMSPAVPPPTPTDPIGLTDLETAGSPGDLLGRWLQTMGPMLAAMQLGSVAGHLSRTTMGSYELPIPRADRTRLLLLPGNMARFADDWSLPAEEVRMWVCLREVTSPAVLGIPHVARRFEQMIESVLTTLSAESSSVLERFEHLDLGSPDALAQLLANPDELVGTEPSPQRQRAAQDLMAGAAVLAGYVEHVIDLAGARLLGGRPALAEAWRRRQLDRDAPARSAEQLLGMDLGPAHREQGVAFVAGVLDRGGEPALARLWDEEGNIPTPNEVEAPGLWLERIDLPAS